MPKKHKMPQYAIKEMPHPSAPKAGKLTKAQVKKLHKGDKGTFGGTNLRMKNRRKGKPPLKRGR